jgi:predicted outer membrane lipoprotein
MSVLVRFVIYMLIGVIVIFLAAILGDNGPWYFAWLVGTVMIVLISVSGAVLLDTQEGDNGKS